MVWVMVDLWVYRALCVAGYCDVGVVSVDSKKFLMESWVVLVVFGNGGSGVVGGGAVVGVIAVVGNCNEDDGLCDCSM
jgi:hypothetical protein